MKPIGDLYRLKLVESSSPISKKPGTPFRLGALGLMQEELCYPNKGVEIDDRDSNPNDLPIITDYKKPYCDLSDESFNLKLVAGRETEVKLEHGVNSNFYYDYVVQEGYEDLIKIEIDPSDGLMTITSFDEFSDTIQVTIVYNNCLECVITLEIESVIGCEIIPDSSPERDGNFSYFHHDHGRRADKFVKYEQLDGFECVVIMDESDIVLGTEHLKSGNCKARYDVHYSDGLICEMLLTVEGLKLEGEDDYDDDDYYPEDLPRCGFEYRIDTLPIGAMAEISTSGYASGGITLVSTDISIRDEEIAVITYVDDVPYIIALSEGETIMDIVYEYSNGYKCINTAPVTVSGDISCGPGLQEVIEGSKGQIATINISSMYNDPTIESVETTIHDETIAKVETIGNSMKITLLRKGVTYLRMVTAYKDGRACTMTTKIIVNDGGRPVDVPPPPGYEDDFEYYPEPGVEDPNDGEDPDEYYPEPSEEDPNKYDTAPTPGTCNYVGEVNYNTSTSQINGCNIYRFKGSSNANWTLEFEGMVFREPDVLYVFDGDPKNGGTLLGSVKWVSMDDNMLLSRTPSMFLDVTEEIDLYVQINSASNTRGQSEYRFGVYHRPFGYRADNGRVLPMDLPNPWA